MIIEMYTVKLFVDDLTYPENLRVKCEIIKLKKGFSSSHIK